MKVKITHTIDFDEVPAKIDELIHLIRRRLAQLSKAPMTTASLPAFNDSVEHVRSGLAIVDSQLEDVTSMLQGYANVIAQLSAPDLPEDMRQATAPVGEEQEDEV
tara:strand:- start:3634 stop:3948 length:315 start_codon:yes stop_codon:yes gene_type:complete